MFQTNSLSDMDIIHILKSRKIKILAPVEVEQKLNAYTYNNNKIPNLKSTACGSYCIAFIIFIL